MATMDIFEGDAFTIVELTRALEVLDVGEHDLGEVDLEQVDLLLQHERQEQVERPVEDLQVEVERGAQDAHQLVRPAVGLPHAVPEGVRVAQGHVPQRLRPHCGRHCAHQSGRQRGARGARSATGRARRDEARREERTDQDGDRRPSRGWPLMHGPEDTAERAGYPSAGHS